MMPNVCPSRVTGRGAVTKPLAASIDPFVGSNMASAMPSTPFISSDVRNCPRSPARAGLPT